MPVAEAELEVVLLGEGVACVAAVDAVAATVLCVASAVGLVEAGEQLETALIATAAQASCLIIRIRRTLTDPFGTWCAPNALPERRRARRSSVASTVHATALLTRPLTRPG